MTGWRAVWWPLWALTWVPLLALVTYGIASVLMSWGWTALVYVMLSLSSLGLWAVVGWPTRVIATEDSWAYVFCSCFSIPVAVLVPWVLPAQVFRAHGEIEDCRVALGPLLPGVTQYSGTTGPTRLYYAICPSGLRPDVEPWGDFESGEPMRIAFLHTDSVWAMPIDLIELRVVEWITLVSLVLCTLCSVAAVVGRVRPDLRARMR
ncbi:hypothetical protein [Actinosynnema sp. NPDC020468]|uniref:hypothetical protein n=1 Tax=Actinosynnema sp. NPDC020468 TaxID=3154488 RepID=UPI0033C130BF